MGILPMLITAESAVPQRVAHPNLELFILAFFVWGWFNVTSTMPKGVILLPPAIVGLTIISMMLLGNVNVASSASHMIVLL